MLQKIAAFFIALFMAIGNLFGANKPIEIKNVKYATESSSQQVDIYLPKKAKGDLSLVLLVHGGAWNSGDRSSYGDLCKNYAKSGYAAATVGYRLTTEGATEKDMLNDIRACLAAVRDTAAQKGVNITDCAIIGYSAGAHLAMLYSYKVTDSPVDVSLCVSMAGPADLTYVSDATLDPALAQAVGALIGVPSMTASDVALYSDRLLEASPVSYIKPGSTPTILVHAVDDTVVLYSNAEKADAALTAAGVEHTLVTLTSGGHDMKMSEAEEKLYSETLYAYSLKYLKTPVQ